MFHCYRNFFIKLLQILRASLLASLAFCVAPACADDEVSERENKIKIAYLFHFAQFTEWEIKSPVFTYCIYEDSHFSDLLKQAYSTKTLGTAIIDVQTINATSTLDHCQIIFFPKEVPLHLLNQISKKPILSIGSQKNILDQGIIHLFEEDQKIRFSINKANALQSNLKISSQLLSLSKEPQP